MGMELQRSETTGIHGYGSRVKPGTTANVKLRFDFQWADATSPSRGMICPRFAGAVCPSSRRGSRECRVRAAPAVSCARLHKGMRTRAYRFSGGNPAFPAQWFDGLCRALPGDEFVLSPSSAD